MRQKYLAFMCSLIVLVESGTPLIRAQTPGQQEQDTDVVKVETDLVQVRAVVTDRNGKPVSGLTKDDFDVSENGKPQSVSFFSEENVRETKTSTALSSQKSATATPRISNNRTTRSIVLFVDTLHLSISSVMRAKEQLKQFVDQDMTDTDAVAVVTTASSLGMLEQFMRDKKMVKYAIDKIALFHRSSSAYSPYIAAEVLSDNSQALNVAMQIVTTEDFANNPPPKDMLENYTVARARAIVSEDDAARRSTWQILRAVCEQMAELPGQRMIAFVSDGFTLHEGGMGADTQSFNEATSKAVKSGVVIYTFFPKGLTVPVEATAASQFSGINFSAIAAAERMDVQNTLRYLAADTGGEAYLNNNDMMAQINRMLEENQRYYAIGYYPHDDDAKSFRNIKIRLKNHPEYKIRTQKGYQPIKEKPETVAATPEEKLFQSMIAALPITAIPVNSTANFLVRNDDDSQVTLMIHIDGTTLEYPQKDGKNHLNCEIAVAVFDSAGKMANNFEEGFNAAYSDEALQRAKKNGFRYEKRIKLAPGLYQLRVGVRDLNGGQIGTSQSWVTVPNLANRKLALSSVILAKEDRALDKSKKDDNNGSARIMPVSAGSVFKLGDPVFYRFVVYNVPTRTEQDSGLLLKVEVLEADKTVYDGPWQPLAPRIVRKSESGMWEIGGQLKMHVERGIYTLRVTLKDPKSKGTATQTVDIELE